MRLMSLRTTRWGAAATAALTATVMCAPVAVAQGVAVPDATTRPLHPSPIRHSGFSSCGDAWGDAKTDSMSQDATGYAPEKDPGSLYTVGKAIGARGLWAKSDSSQRRVTGQGVGVAVLDSGVSQVAGLNGTGKVTYGPDLSIEGNGVQVNQDTFGHGTYMAGIIAGRATTASSSDLATASARTQLGVAPDAKILAMKLATRDGSTDVSQVIAALDWVTQHPVMPNGTKIRVINLSYGTNSAQSYLADPLAAAAENAWKHGIVVVTSAGNNAALDGRLTDPAIDPFVLAVGATGASMSLTGWAYNNAVPAHFSQVGSVARHADLVAPGVSIVSSRTPGSYIDDKYPEGRVAGDTTGTLFRGSGTSQSAAVLSGSVALLLQAYPTLTPDQVKYALRTTSHPVSKGSTLWTGAGTIDLAAAFTTASQITGSSALKTAAVQSFAKATGLGTIQGARGAAVILDPAGSGLTGEIDVQGVPWKPATWWAATSGNTAWSGGRWLGTIWTGDNWATTTRWSASRWSASRWSTANWTSLSWTASRWSASRWSSSQWSSSFWTASFWADSTTMPTTTVTTTTTTTPTTTKTTV
jgi:serine protease AprX